MHQCILPIIHWCFMCPITQKNKAAEGSLWHQLAYISLDVGMLSYWNIVYVFNQPMNNIWNCFHNIHQEWNLSMVSITQLSLHHGSCLAPAPTAERPTCPPHEIGAQSLTRPHYLHFEPASSWQVDSTETAPNLGVSISTLSSRLGFLFLWSKCSLSYMYNFLFISLSTHSLFSAGWEFSIMLRWSRKKCLWLPLVERVPSSLEIKVKMDPLQVYRSTSCLVYSHYLAS